MYIFAWMNVIFPHIHNADIIVSQIVLGFAGSLKIFVWRRRIAKDTEDIVLSITLKKKNQDSLTDRLMNNLKFL